jgi:hypothetical protein
MRCFSHSSPIDASAWAALQKFHRKSKIVEPRLPGFSPGVFEGGDKAAHEDKGERK